MSAGNEPGIEPRIRLAGAPGNSPDMVEFARFLLLGGFAALANWASRFAWQAIMPFGSAVIAAYLTGSLIAFILFRIFGFPGAARPLGEQLIWFGLVNLAGIAQVWLTANLLVGWLFPLAGFSGAPAEAIGHGIAIAVPAVTSYFGHKHLTFSGARG